MGYAASRATPKAKFDPDVADHGRWNKVIGIAHLIVKSSLILIVSLTACAHPKPAPQQQDCEFAVVGKTSFRSCSRTTVDVVAVRRFAEHTAGGSAILHEVTLESAKSSPLTRVAAARAWLALASLYQHDADALGTVSRRGLDELGTDYLFIGKRRFRDDTGNLIHWAEELEHRGQRLEAAATLRRALSARVEMTLRAYRGLVE